MYIAPNTTIYLCMNVPLKPDYEETFWWNSEGNQLSYFRGKAVGTFTAQSYQRADREYCRVEAKYASVYKCNYMMFYNVSHENKMFYAFIENVTYINENVVEITYSIDVMQTWWFDIVPKTCFIERQHSVTDEVGDNLVPESFDLGDYVVDDKARTGVMNKWAIVVASTLNPDYGDAVGNMYAGVYSALNLIAFDEDHVGSLQSNYIEAVIDYIAEATRQSGVTAINNVFMMPSFFVPANEWAAGWDETASHDTFDPINTELVFPAKTSGLFSDYTVKNNKLYTYPYSFLYVCSSSGSSSAYPYEYFEKDSGGNVRFDLVGNYSTNPEIALVPKFYKGDAYNVDESLRMFVGTQCAWTCDAFNAWQAYLGSELGSMTGNALYGLSGIASMNPVQIGISSVTMLHQVSNLLASGLKSYIDPPQKQGNSDGNLLMSNKTQDFYFYNKHIRKEFAEIIDSYFQRYGYACHKIQMPVLHARQKWTYIKTVGCDFGGNIPANDMEKIRAVFNNGVAVWSDYDNIGDYTISNPVLGA